MFVNAVLATLGTVVTLIFIAIAVAFIIKWLSTRD